MTGCSATSTKTADLNFIHPEFYIQMKWIVSISITEKTIQLFLIENKQNVKKKNQNDIQKVHTFIGGENE